MRRQFLLVLGALTALIVAAAPSAAQTPPAMVVPPSGNPAGNVELFGAMAFHTTGFAQDESCQGCHSKGFGFGGSARAAFQLNTALSVQLDTWLEHLSGYSYFEGFECTEEDGCAWSSNRFGIGSHLTFNHGPVQVGGLVSVGSRTTQLFAFGPPEEPLGFVNLAGEAAFNGDRMRVYAQAGYTVPIAPEWFRELWHDFGMRDVYARLVGTFYVRPNLSVSANLGAELRLANDDFLGGHGITWGSRAEYQFAGSPLYVFGSYQGSHNSFDDGFYQVEHIVRLGIGLNVGGADLQARDRAVGLKDYNCVFGVETTGLCLLGHFGGGG